MPRASSGRKQSPHGCAGFMSDGPGPGCLSWDREVLPAEPSGPQHVASPWPPGWRQGAYREDAGCGCTLAWMGKAAEELRAGCCGAPRDLRHSSYPGLKESIIGNEQKPGPWHCQLSGFYLKSHATWDFLKVLVPRTK